MTLEETAEDKAALTALQNEAPIELVQPDPEPKPDPQPDQQPQAEPKAADPEPKKPVRLVPHEALHEERVKRQALERELAELRKPRPQPEPEKSDEIDENENPIGSIAQLKAELRAMKEERAKAVEQVTEGREIMARMAPRVAAYAKEHPEYAEQFKYLRNSRAEELSLLGHAPDAIAAQIQIEEMALAKQTLEKDLDPGEVIARMATARGWRAKEVAKDPKPEQNPEAEKKIERLQAGHKAAKSPSAAGGGGPEPEMTLERLAELDGAAFDNAWKKHGPRLMGG